MARLLLVALLGALFVACGDGAGGDAATGDPVFTPALHNRFPQLSQHGAPSLHAPEVVTVTWADSPFRDDVERFGQVVVGSQWLQTVGKDYGVGAGTLLAQVRLAARAPAGLDEQGVLEQLNQHVTTGELPAPSPSHREIVYLLYFPRTTTLTAPDGTQLCADATLAYHDGGVAHGIPFAFGVIADCQGSLDEITSSASHELIEAATDPSPGNGWFLEVPRDDPWSGVNGFEAADLCPNQSAVEEGGFRFARVYSNSAAAQGAASPCVPAPAGEVFVDVSAEPSRVLALAAGESTSFTLTGWSSALVPNWSLLVARSPSSTFTPIIGLSGTAVNNGAPVTLTLSVPAGTPPGEVGALLVLSGQEGGFEPVTIRTR